MLLATKCGMEPVDEANTSQWHEGMTSLFGRPRVVDPYMRDNAAVNVPLQYRSEGQIVGAVVHIKVLHACSTMVVKPLQHSLLALGGDFRR